MKYIHISFKKSIPFCVFSWHHNIDKNHWSGCLFMANNCNSRGYPYETNTGTMFNVTSVSKYKLISF